MGEAKAPLWVRLWRAYREKGVLGVGFGALGHAGYRRLVLLERPLDQPLPQVVAPTEAAIRPLRRDDEATFAALGQEDTAVFRGRLESGHQCWGAWCAGVLRHVEWLAVREAWIEHLGCRLRLDDGVVYVYRAFTDPAFRGIGLTPATHARCLDAMREQGYKLALCGVVPDNRSALSLWIKLGYRRIGIASTFGRKRRRWLAVRVRREPAASAGWKIERR